MEDDIIKELFNRYEKSIEIYIRYKDRIERHEKELRAANQIIQSLKAEIAFKNAKIIELEDKLKINKK